MTRLLGLILHGCWHRWERKGNRYLSFVNGETMQDHRCTRCGRWKAFRL